MFDVLLKRCFSKTFHDCKRLSRSGKVNYFKAAHMNEFVVEKLKSCNIRPSVQRMAILTVLLENRIHPTAEKVFQMLHKEYPTLSRTTVYNTLTLFCTHNLAQSVIIEDSEMRYDGDVRPHAHFKCRQCGKVSDIFMDAGKFLPKPPEHFMVEELHLNYRGICGECRKSFKINAADNL